LPFVTELESLEIDSPLIYVNEQRDYPHGENVANTCVYNVKLSECEDYLTGYKLGHVNWDHSTIVSELEQEIVHDNVNIDNVETRDGLLGNKAEQSLPCCCKLKGLLCQHMQVTVDPATLNNQFTPDLKRPTGSQVCIGEFLKPDTCTYRPCQLSSGLLHNDDSDSIVYGRLLKHYSKWVDIGSSDYVLSVIKHGYHLPFQSFPDRKVFNNNKNCFNYLEFMDKSIIDLLNSGAIVQVESVNDLFLVSPLNVADQGKKLRLIVNLRYLNSHLRVHKFKFEDIYTFIDLADTGDKFISWDLISCYHHVNICIDHQPYLGFTWKNSWYKFRSLAFGISSAPALMTKILKAPIKYWRGVHNIKCFMFLDDGNAFHHDFDQCVRISSIIQTDLKQLGFMFHSESPKSYWEPRTDGKVLGYLVDLPSGTFSVPQSRLEKIKVVLRFIESSNYWVSARTIAKLTGHLQSMSLALGPIARLWTRQLYYFINAQFSWKNIALLPDLAIQEFLFWNSQFNKSPSAPIWHRNTKIDSISYSDSGNDSWGGFSITLDDNVFARGNWEVHEGGSFTSSTFRELKGCLKVLQSCIHSLRGKNLLHRTDNQNVVRILYHGSRNPNLQELAIKIFKLAVENSIILRAEWIPRDANEQADYLSKIVDTEDYMLNPVIFNVINLLWGSFSFDRFASSNTNQLEAFSSRWWNPKARFIDAFSKFWNGHLNWVFPPPRLIAKVMRHFEASKACGCLLFPFWSSAWWWNTLCSEPFTLNNQFINWSDVPPVSGMFIPTIKGNSVFSERPPTFRIIIGRICNCGFCVRSPSNQNLCMYNICILPALQQFNSIFRLCQNSKAN
jgi:hypothetical protein